MRLAEAQDARRARGEQQARLDVEIVTNLLCDAVEEHSRTHLAGSSTVKNYQMVGPTTRKKLSGLLNHYRKMAHPFTACVRDNRKRFPGPGQAEKVCAVLTDLEKGTTKWRKGGSKKTGAKLSLSLDADGSVVERIDDELFGLLCAIAEVDYKPIIGLEA
jgi:hypothetical protein